MVQFTSSGIVYGYDQDGFENKISWKWVILFFILLILIIILIVAL